MTLADKLWESVSDSVRWSVSNYVLHCSAELTHNFIWNVVSDSLWTPIEDSIQISIESEIYNKLKSYDFN